MNSETFLNRKYFSWFMEITQGVSIMWLKKRGARQELWSVPSSRGGEDEDSPETKIEKVTSEAGGKLVKYTVPSKMKKVFQGVGMVMTVLLLSEITWGLRICECTCEGQRAGWSRLKWETEIRKWRRSIDSSFEEFFYEGKQRNWVIAEEVCEVKGRIFF